MNTIFQVLKLLGSLGLFLYGMTLMSGALQKVAGDRMRSFLAAMTSNPFKRIFTGLAVTAIIQSSSATTVMVVSFVNAGLLTLTQSVGVIMGANIGTTVTAWLISLLGFKMDISTLSLPLIGLGFVLMMLRSKKNKSFGELLIGFAILFLGLAFLKDAVPDLSRTPEVLAFLQGWANAGFWSVLAFVGIGTVLTIVLQSSSATMALTLVMSSNGWIPFEIAAAMVLGENIGTTITANIAAAVGNVSARRAALAHTVFNVVGVCWVLLLFHPFLKLVAFTVTGFGSPSPYESNESVLYGISMLHTLFNVCNTLLLVGFTPGIVKVVSCIVKQSKEEEVFRLKYIHRGMLSTSELSLEQSKQEIVHFAKLPQVQFGYVKELFGADNSKQFDELYAKIENYEQIADRVEMEIATYLNNIAESGLSELSRLRIQAMYKIISELESIGDSNYNLARILQRGRVNRLRFDRDLNEKMEHMFSLLDHALEVMIANVQAGYTALYHIQNAVDAEKGINEYRNQLREEHVHSLEDNRYDYYTGVIYSDLIAECEHIGDFIINISEAIMEIKTEYETR